MVLHSYHFIIYSTFKDHLLYFYVSSEFKLTSTLNDIKWGGELICHSEYSWKKMVVFEWPKLNIFAFRLTWRQHIKFISFRFHPKLKSPWWIAAKRVQNSTINWLDGNIYCSKNQNAFRLLFSLSHKRTTKGNLRL